MTEQLVDQIEQLETLVENNPQSVEYLTTLCSKYKDFIEILESNEDLYLKRFQILKDEFEKLEEENKRHKRNLSKNTYDQYDTYSNLSNEFVETKKNLELEKRHLQKQLREENEIKKQLQVSNNDLKEQLKQFTSSLGVTEMPILRDVESERRISKLENQSRILLMEKSRLKKEIDGQSKALQAHSDKAWKYEEQVQELINLLSQRDQEIRDLKERERERENKNKNENRNENEQKNEKKNFFEKKKENDEFLLFGHENSLPEYQSKRSNQFETNQYQTRTITQAKHTPQRNYYGNSFEENGNENENKQTNKVLAKENSILESNLIKSQNEIKNLEFELNICQKNLGVTKKEFQNLEMKYNLLKESNTNRGNTESFYQERFDLLSDQLNNQLQINQEKENENLQLENRIQSLQSEYNIKQSGNEKQLMNKFLESNSIYKRQINNLEDLIKNLTNRIKKLDQRSLEYSKLKIEYEKLKELNETLQNNLKNEKEEYEQIIHNMKKNQNNRKNNNNNFDQQIEQENLELREKNNEILEENNNLKKQLNNLFSNRDDQNKFDSKNKINNKNKISQSKNGDEINNLREELIDKEDEIQKLRDLLMNQKEKALAIESKPNYNYSNKLLQNDIDEKDDEINKLRNLLIDKENDLSEQKKKIRHLKKEIDNYKKFLLNNNDNDNNTKQLLDELNDLEKELSKKNKLIKELEKKPNTNYENDNLEQNQKIKRLERKLDDFKRKFDKKNDQFENLKKLYDLEKDKNVGSNSDFENNDGEDTDDGDDEKLKNLKNENNYYKKQLENLNNKLEESDNKINYLKQLLNNRNKHNDSDSDDDDFKYYELFEKYSKLNNDYQKLLDELEKEQQKSKEYLKKIKQLESKLDPENEFNSKFNSQSNSISGSGSGSDSISHIDFKKKTDSEIENNKEKDKDQEKVKKPETETEAEAEEVESNLNFANKPKNKKNDLGLLNYDLQKKLENEQKLNKKLLNQNKLLALKTNNYELELMDNENEIENLQNEINELKKRLNNQKPKNIHYQRSSIKKKNDTNNDFSFDENKDYYNEILKKAKEIEILSQEGLNFDNNSWRQNVYKNNFNNNDDDDNDLFNPESKRENEFLKNQLKAKQKLINNLKNEILQTQELLDPELKNWICECLERIYQDYFDPDQLTNEQIQDFQQLILDMLENDPKKSSSKLLAYKRMEKKVLEIIIKKEGTEGLKKAMELLGIETSNISHFNSAFNSNNNISKISDDDDYDNGDENVDFEQKQFELHSGKMENVLILDKGDEEKKKRALEMQRQLQLQLQNQQNKTNRLKKQFIQNVLKLIRLKKQNEEKIKNKLNTLFDEIKNLDQEIESIENDDYVFYNDF
ncbi:hypothetical protein M0813_26510 [Anaeramoeba flamelloides]|uniref:GRIP domain-containing protein n=1 Tax=Anaeramoeba flamelloides TaxID=1746091 RepID=A0ABQ8Y022_9EUKA|nr:hypothetical protein M0813_26510 [Anaeramoeba flamelloides]